MEIDATQAVIDRMMALSPRPDDGIFRVSPELWAAILRMAIPQEATPEATAETDRIRVVLDESLAGTDWRPVRLYYWQRPRQTMTVWKQS